jgi:hypothetical protein
MVPSALCENRIRTPATRCSFLLSTLKSLQFDTELTLSVSDMSGISTVDFDQVFLVRCLMKPMLR